MNYKQIHEELLKVDEVAEILGVSKSTIYTWTSEQVIPHFKIGGRVLFRRNHIDKWLSERFVADKRSMLP